MQGAVLGPPFTFGHPVQGLCGVRRVQRQLDHATVEPADLFEPGVGEDAQHGRVLRECVGAEATDAGLARDGGQLLEKQRSDPPAMHRIVQ